MVPINTNPEKLQHLARTFQCEVGSLPFTYPGLPLSLTKPRVIDISPLVSKCERRLAATSVFLNQAGHQFSPVSIALILHEYFPFTTNCHSTN
jgi:hypothetical protein